MPKSHSIIGGYAAMTDMFHLKRQSTSAKIAWKILFSRLLMREGEGQMTKDKEHVIVAAAEKLKEVVG